jgi:hypothetical protein
MLVLAIVVFVIGLIMILCGKGTLDLIGCVLAVIGVLLFLLSFEPIEYDTKEGVKEETTVKVGTTAGATEGLMVELGNDYHYQYPQVELEDVDLLARLITAEQGYNAGEDAYYYTASVVWNRMNSDKFPDEMRDVIYQPGQYQCVENGHIERDYDDVAWEVAVAVLEDGTWIPENVVYQAEFEQGSGVWEQVGRTYFCYE